jgi:hypothetical protein
MDITRVFGVSLTCVCLLSACDETSNALPDVNDPDTGAGGSGSSLTSTYGTPSGREALRERMTAALFGIPEASISLQANYNYNDWGQGSSCSKGGYHGGHSGIDVQTKSVAGTQTADERAYSIEPSGSFIGYRSHSWGTTAIVRTQYSLTLTGTEHDVFTHYLHLRSVNTSLRPGDCIFRGTFLGIQGSPNAANQNDSEHVHIEFSTRELDYGRGAHPEVCDDSSDATLDPYPILDAFFQLPGVCTT